MSKRINIQGLDIELTSKQGLKNIYLRVKAPEGIVSISAPSGVSLDLISEFVLRNIRTITETRDRILSRRKTPEREYISGRKFLLWGKPYPLEVQEAAGKSYTIKFTGDSIVLAVPENSSHEGREAALNELYRSEIKRVLPDLIKACAIRVGVQVNSFSVRNMKTCWGTCHIRKKRIIINLQLAKKPPECLEYVVVHELVHLIEKNHTKRFHELVAKNFPDEKHAKKILAEAHFEI